MPPATEKYAKWYLSCLSLSFYPLLCTPCWLTVPTSRVPASPLMLIYMARRFLCSVSVPPPTLCPIPFEVKWSRRRTKQANRKFWMGCFRGGEGARSWCGMAGEPFCHRMWHASCVWQTLCVGLWQPSVNFHFINSHLSMHFPYVHIYLFIYFHILRTSWKAAAWLAQFPISIFHFAVSPFRHLHFVATAAAAVATSRCFSLFFLSAKSKSNAKQTFLCLLKERKNAKFFCNAAARMCVSVCGTWRVLNWIYTCAELIRVPCNDVFQFKLAAAAADVPQDNEKETSTNETIVLLPAYRLGNTLPRAGDTFLSCQSAFN